MLSILLLFLYPVFFYKNILLSFMIVFLIANKISSFGVRDEEEERGLRDRGERGETEEWRTEREMDRPGCLLPERGTSHLLCKCDNVSFLQ